MPVVRKHTMASRGVSTIGSPLTLNDVSLFACDPLLAARSDQSASRRNSAPLAGPADVSGAGSHDAVSPFSLQREDGALRVSASGDPAAIRQFVWVRKDDAATGLHTLGGGVDVADIEVIKPIRERLDWKLREYAPGCL